MATIDLGDNQYSSYATAAEADTYLAADVGLSAPWAALSDEQKARALISATRHLVGLTWTAGDAPEFTDIPDTVRDVCSILAANVAADPSILDGTSGESNIRKAGAGSAQVEFFSPTRGRILPKRLTGMLGALVSIGRGASGAAGPFDASVGAERCPDGVNLGLIGPLS